MYLLTHLIGNSARQPTLSYWGEFIAHLSLTIFEELRGENTLFTTKKINSHYSHFSKKKKKTYYSLCKSPTIKRD